MPSAKKSLPVPIIILLLLVSLGVWWWNQERPQTINVPPGDYLFCWWNVENLFDDKNDGRKLAGDRDYDPWFSEQPEDLKLKLDKLTETLLKMNNGKGPDILAVGEVESKNAAGLLMGALNAKLKDA